MQTISADTTQNVNNEVMQSTNEQIIYSGKTSQQIYNNLNEQDKAAFNEATENLSEADKNETLQMMDNRNKMQRGVKTWLIKTALNQAAKMAGKAATSVYIEKTMLKLSGAIQDGEESGAKVISDGLVKYLGVKRSTDNAIGKVAVKILL